MAFGRRRAKVLGLLSGAILVSKISNLCDSDPPTSHTDRQTDRQTDDMQLQYRALQYTRGKKPLKTKN